MLQTFLRTVAEKCNAGSCSCKSIRVIMPCFNRPACCFQSTCPFIPDWHEMLYNPIYMAVGNEAMGRREVRIDLYGPVKERQSLKVCLRLLFKRESECA